MRRRLRGNAAGQLQDTIAKRAFAGRSDRLLSFVLRRFFAQHKGHGRESGMEKLLNSLPGTIIAGFVLVIVEILVIHAIH